MPSDLIRGWTPVRRQGHAPMLESTLVPLGSKRALDSRMAHTPAGEPMSTSPRYALSCRNPTLVMPGIFPSGDRLMPCLLSCRSSLVLAAVLLTIAPAAAQQPRPNQLPPPQAQPQPRPNQLPPPQAQPRPAAPQAPAQAPAAQAPAAAPIKPYTAVAVTMPTPVADPSYETFRKQLADVAKRKDRAGLAKLVVSQGFFWESENGDKADKKKPAVANLEQAIGGFAGPDAQGWDVLAQAADDPTLEPLPDHANVMCGPAGPEIDGQAFEALVKQTGTEPGDWAFPVAPDLEVRSAGQPNAPVIE